MVVRIGPLENLLHLHLHEASQKVTVSEFFLAKGIVLKNGKFPTDLWFLNCLMLRKKSKNIRQVVVIGIKIVVVWNIGINKH